MPGVQLPFKGPPPPPMKGSILASEPTSQGKPVPSCHPPQLGVLTKPLHSPPPRPPSRSRPTRRAPTSTRTHSTCTRPSGSALVTTQNSCVVRHPRAPRCLSMATLAMTRNWPRWLGDMWADHAYYSQTMMQSWCKNFWKVIVLAAMDREIVLRM